MLEQISNNIKIDIDEIIHAIYTNQIQNGGYIADYWSNLNSNLFNKFSPSINDEVEDAIQTIYNIASEDFFAIGFKTCLAVLQQLK